MTLEVYYRFLPLYDAEFISAVIVFAVIVFAYGLINRIIRFLQ